MLETPPITLADLGLGSVDDGWQFGEEEEGREEGWRGKGHRDMIVPLIDGSMDRYIDK